MVKKKVLLRLTYYGVKLALAKKLSSAYAFRKCNSAKSILRFKKRVTKEQGLCLSNGFYAKQFILNIIFL